ncbi:MAG: heme ABC transporter ATP-binding protein [Bacteroidota bacterium]
MIKVQNISVHIGAKKILQDISLALHPKEVLAIIGANGAGKSTLLKAIAGQIQPKTGNIFLNERSVKDWKANELAQVRAVLSQHTQLSFSFKVLDTILLGRFPQRAKESSSQSRAIAYWALEKVNLTNKADQDIRTLSGGERQRAHFARILVQLYDNNTKANKYLLLDEPTASQDIAQQHHLLRLAELSAKELGYGVLVILHDMNLAAQYADRIALLKDGKMITAGTPRSVLTPKNIKTAFDIDALVKKHPVYDCLQITAVHQPASINLSNI